MDPAFADIKNFLTGEGRSLVIAGTGTVFKHVVNLVRPAVIDAVHASSRGAKTEYTLPDLDPERAEQMRSFPLLSLMFLRLHKHLDRRDGREQASVQAWRVAINAVMIMHEEVREKYEALTYRFGRLYDVAFGKSPQALTAAQQLAASECILQLDPMFLHCLAVCRRTSAAVFTLRSFVDNEPLLVDFRNEIREAFRVLDVEINACTDYMQRQHWLWGDLKPQMMAAVQAVPAPEPAKTPQAAAGAAAAAEARAPTTAAGGVGSGGAIKAPTDGARREHGAHKRPLTNAMKSQ